MSSAAAEPTPLRPVPAERVRYYDVVSADGTRLRAWTNDVDGSKAGPTVLLCNGLGTNPFTWPALLDPACEVRVISWNHRGVGGSDRPTDRRHVGIEAFVEDALAVLDDAGLDAAPVMGWSMGVNTAFELATTHPERVTGLFAVGGVPGGTFASMLAPLGVPRFARRAITVNATRVMMIAGKAITQVTSRLPIGAISAEVLTHSGFMLPTPDLTNTRVAVREFLTTPIDWYMHLALETSRHLRVSLRSIDVPTAFVAGRYDLLASAHDMRTAAERILDATFTELAATHFVSMEQPEQVYELMLEWLERVPE